MVVTIGFSHHESEGDGFVNQGSFPEIALVINRFPTRVGSFPGRASQRGEMPQREAPLVVLMDGSGSLRQMKRRAGKLAPNLISSSTQTYLKF
jgi:hypothetical protein